ncbi:hypothetical protein CAC42_470 [Sphaceloma murrayae]|uniref:Uncharacterized protein n=1 Tax=Sphaceloma murrayae TaxID=2082308 RepID=A0A2K1R3K9_9PEZI|nr:hypothetical protein CAC42_470 [Sphaceloma murrayae]
MSSALEGIPRELRFGYARIATLSKEKLCGLCIDYKIPFMASDDVITLRRLIYRRSVDLYIEKGVLPKDHLNPRFNPRSRNCTISQLAFIFTYYGIRFDDLVRKDGFAERLDDYKEFILAKAEKDSQKALVAGTIDDAIEISSDEDEVVARSSPMPRYATRSTTIVNSPQSVSSPSPSEREHTISPLLDQPNLRPVKGICARLRTQQATPLSSPTLGPSSTSTLRSSFDPSALPQPARPGTEHPTVGSASLTTNPRTIPIANVVQPLTVPKTTQFKQSGSRQTPVLSPEADSRAAEIRAETKETVGELLQHRNRALRSLGRAIREFGLENIVISVRE